MLREVKVSHSAIILGFAVSDCEQNVPFILSMGSIAKDRMRGNCNEDAVACRQKQ